MTAYRDDDEDDWDEDDPAFDDDDDDDDEPTIPCPSCRREILEDTPRCPYCEQYLSAEDGGGSHRPTWIVLTALVCLGLAVWWVVSGR